MPDEKRRANFKIWYPVCHFHNYAKLSINFDDLLNNIIISSKPPQYFEKHEWSTYDIRCNIGNITVPTLIVVGDDDIPNIKIGSQLLQKSISNSRLVIIENCGHWPFVEAPEIFFKKVLPFLSN
jgi:proline iminopeptidase